MPESREKTVKIRLPLLAGVERQEPVFVGCNDREWLIERGVETELPACAAEILLHAEQAELEARRYRGEKAQG